MTVSVRNLSVLAYAKGFSLWNYRTTNTNDPQSEGYFDDASPMLADGDVIFISAPGYITIQRAIRKEDGGKIHINRLS